MIVKVEEHTEQYNSFELWLINAEKTFDEIGCIEGDLDALVSQEVLLQVHMFSLLLKIFVNHGNIGNINTITPNTSS